MGKFKKSLMGRVEEEEKRQQKQEDLKEQAGIADDDFYVKEKGAKDYLIAILRGLLSCLITFLVFVGIATWLNPESRLILFELFPFF